MRTSIGAVTALALALAPGCMLQSLSAQNQLQDQVHAFNDEARWARTDLAAQRVTADYQADFIRSHRRWGREIRVADADLTNIALLDDGARATAIVTVSWVDERRMQVFETTLRQHWVKVDMAYLLEREEIIDGSEDLFERLDPDEGETAGDEGPIALR